MKKLVPVFFFAAVVAFSTAWLHSTSEAQEETVEPSVYELLDLFSETLQQVRTNYVKPVDDADLIRGAVRGMLSTLDPHSSYLSPEQMKKSQEQTSGQFGGIGIQVTMENGWVKVISPIDDTPGAEAGIQAGDFITEIDGEPVLGMSLDDAVKKMRGPPGADIVLTIEREGAEAPLELNITRAIINTTAAEVRREADALVVRIKTFNRQTLSNVSEGIEEVSAEAGGLDQLNGVVLDLRNNPGGLLETAVQVTDAFLDRGDIVSVRGRNMDESSNFTAEEGDLVDGMPIVVLINGGSASASEIVAGALQDHKRGVVIGTKSFGKGSVQTVFNLGPTKGGVKITTSWYYTPSGRSIQGRGIIPDIQFDPRAIAPVEDEEPRREFLSESDMRNSLENESLMNLDEDEEARQQLQERMAELRTEDPLLAYAIDVLSAVNALDDS